MSSRASRNIGSQKSAASLWRASISACSFVLSTPGRSVAYSGPSGWVLSIFSAMSRELGSEVEDHGPLLHGHRLGEGQRHRIPAVRGRQAARAHVLLLLELDPAVAVVAVTRPAGVALQRVVVRHVGTALLLQPVARGHPDFRASVLRAAADLLPIRAQLRRRHRRAAETHRAHYVAEPHLDQPVIDAHAQ